LIDCYLHCKLQRSSSSIFSCCTAAHKLPNTNYNKLLLLELLLLLLLLLKLLLLLLLLLKLLLLLP
jgi:hypothetical protein